MDTLSITFMALSDPTRRSILGRLAHGPATVNELAKPFNVSQQAISKHLAYLQRARLIDKRRNGRQQFCTLNPAPFKGVSGWVQECQQFWKQSFERLDVVLQEMKLGSRNRGQR